MNARQKITKCLDLFIVQTGTHDRLGLYTINQFKNTQRKNNNKGLNPAAPLVLGSFVLIYLSKYRNAF